MSNLFKCFFMCLLVVAFSSCGNDDKDEPNENHPSVVGKWECIYDSYGDFWDEPLIYVFDEEGTGYQWFSDEPFSYRLEFTYSITSSKLKIKTKYDDVYNLRYELSSDGRNLTLYGWDDDDMSILKFSRVNL